jgi:hypothetical protein
MQSNKVITGVKFHLDSKIKKSSFFLVEPSGYEHSLIEVIASELDKFTPVDSAVSNLLQWSTDKAGPFALLISLDSRYATLREIDKKGEPLLRNGEKAQTFFEYPLQGLPKFAGALEREIGIYPSECRKFGYSNRPNRYSLPRRTQLAGYAEFDPYFVAKLGLKPLTAPTGSLVWILILGDTEIRRLGGSPEDIQLELESRLKSTNQNKSPDERDGFYDSSNFRMSEIVARSKRAKRYWDAITYELDRLINVAGQVEIGKVLKTKVADAVGDIDLAIELHIISRSADEKSRPGSYGVLSGILWDRVVDLEFAEGGLSKGEATN